MKNYYVLSIGNSFSDDMQYYMYDIFSANGYTSKVANLYIGGCPQSRHYDNMLKDNHEYEFKVFDKDGYHEYYNYAISDVLESKWDIVTLQQASYESGDPDRFIDKETGVPYVNLIHDWFIDHYKARNEIKWLYHSTWSYEKNFDGDTFRIYDYSQDKMNKGIVDCINQFVMYNPIFDGIIPNYYVVKTLREKYGITATRDGFHLTYGLGRYAVALMAVAIITGELPLNSNKDYENLTDEDKELARNIVKLVLDEKENHYIM